jgi:hypothetical protein
LPTFPPCQYLRECCFILAIAEAPRKDLAQLSAALDLLAKFKDAYPNITIPPCGLPRGSQTSPEVSFQLYRFLLSEGFVEPICKFFETDEAEEEGRHVCVLSIEGTKYTGIDLKTSPYFDSTLHLTFRSIVFIIKRSRNHTGIRTKVCHGLHVRVFG